MATSEQTELARALVKLTAPITSTTTTSTSTASTYTKTTNSTTSAQQHPHLKAKATMPKPPPVRIRAQHNNKLPQQLIAMMLEQLLNLVLVNPGPNLGGP
jgi:hypothetical protein